MRYVYLALYAEGKTDNLFLAHVIERTVDTIVRVHAQEMVDVAPVVIANPGAVSGGAERILAAARIACNCQILIVHKDADAPDPEGALSARYRPGEQLVSNVSDVETICRTLVPIIPVRMTEAWLLADIPAVLAEIVTNISEQQLRDQLKDRNVKVPAKIQQVGSISDPKDVLDHIVRIVRTHHNTTRHDLYEPVGRNIDLERLGKVPAYQQFVKDITEALKTLHIIAPPAG